VKANPFGWIIDNNCDNDDDADDDDDDDNKDAAAADEDDDVTALQLFEDRAAIEHLLLNGVLVCEQIENLRIKFVQSVGDLDCQHLDFLTIQSNADAALALLLAHCAPAALSSKYLNVWAAA